MKKVVASLLICFLSVLVLPNSVYAGVYENNMRGVWISTVYNLDYPSTKNNVTAQQNEFNEKLDALQAVGINTVVVQVRPKGDALYASSMNPWSDVLTGQQGKNPGYDPLAYMIEAAHARGMEIHAWLNPYRVTTSGTDVNALCATHPARLNPSWVLSYNNALFYNPENEEVKQHIVDTVQEIVINYNVDGIHFDDYFYPSNYPLPQGETKDGPVANARRQAVNDMVSRVSQTIKTVNALYGKSVKFGISPPGIWKNSSSDITGSKTSGRESYYALFADTRTWIKNGWIDYVVPQIYWKIGHAKADYTTLVQWWSNEVSGTNVKLYIGQGIYSDEVATQIDQQLQMNQMYPQIKGSMYFSLRDLLNNRQSCKTKIASFYALYPGDSNNNGNTSDITNGQVTNPGNTSTVFPGSSNTSNGTNLQANVGKTGIVHATTLNIRAGARTDRDIIKKVPAGTKLTVLSVLGDWYKVKLSDGIVGWANSAYITVASSEVSNSISSNGSQSVIYPAAGTVTATTLNVRVGARTDRAVITSVAKGTKLTVLSKQEEWYKVKLTNGIVGWVSSVYVAVGTTNTTYTPIVTPKFPRNAKVTANSLNIRSGARVDRPLVTTVTKGTTLILLDQLGEWYKVKLNNGKIGWAVKSYIT